MAETKNLYEKLGLPVIDQEESEDLTQALTSLADPDSFDGTVMADTAAAAPGNALENVFYINFNPKTDTQPPHLKAQLESLQKNVGLNAQFMDIKANETVNSKVTSKQLPDDQTLKANYKAKVVNYLAENSPWTAGYGIQTIYKEFVVEKNTFHQTLVTTFTQGLQLPSTVAAQLEGFLTNIKNTINVSSDAKQGLQFFILLTIYQRDDVVQAWRPSLRTIYFKVDQSLSSYTKSKNDKSSGQNVKVKIDYVQADGQFNESLFEKNAKASIEQLVGAKSGSIIAGKLDIPL